MKSKYKYAILLLIGVFILSFYYNNLVSQQALIGSYVNTNYDYIPVLSEVPNVSDTLTLYANNTFKSNYWGKGYYKIFYTVTGTKIQIIYKYQFGKAGYEASIARINWGSPAIILNKSKNHFYEKVE